MSILLKNFFFVTDLNPKGVIDTGEEGRRSVDVL